MGAGITVYMNIITHITQYVNTYCVIFSDFIKLPSSPLLPHRPNTNTARNPLYMVYQNLLYILCFRSLLFRQPLFAAKSRRGDDKGQAAAVGNYFRNDVGGQENGRV